METQGKVYTAEQGEKIMTYIMKGMSVEEATAKMYIGEDNAASAKVSATYKKDANAFAVAMSEFVAVRKEMISVFGAENFTKYNIAAQKNKLNALAFGQYVRPAKNAGWKKHEYGA